MAEAAHAAAIAVANAIKASGVLVRVKPEEFSKLLGRIKDPLVVVAEGGLFSTHYEYLTSYKGLAFHTKSDAPLPLPAGTELVTAEGIWIPG